MVAITCEHANQLLTRIQQKCFLKKEHINRKRRQVKVMEQATVYGDAMNPRRTSGGFFICSKCLSVAERKLWQQRQRQGLQLAILVDALQEQ